jgi:hypothetical protein
MSEVHRMSISAACWEAGVGPINAPVALLHLSGYTVQMFGKGEILDYCGRNTSSVIGCSTKLAVRENRAGSTTVRQHRV